MSYGVIQAMLNDIAHDVRYTPAESEGPRRIGYCVYCKKTCQGVTANCELRVWEDSRRPPYA